MQSIDVCTSSVPFHVVNSLFSHSCYIIIIIIIIIIMYKKWVAKNVNLTINFSF